MSSQIYKRVGNVNPRRSFFDLSYEKLFTCDMGQLIPVMCDEVVPGDFFKIGNQALVRFQPLVAPVMHEINMYVHYFFVPYRLLWDDWEEFISGGVSGDETPAIPTWDPTFYSANSLWDYLGFPPSVKPTGAFPLAFPRQAYVKIFNDYYRDENLQAEVADSYEYIINRYWQKDYFTSALEHQQRGTAPALPISGSTAAVWADSAFNPSTAGITDGGPVFHSGGVDTEMHLTNAQAKSNAKAFMNGNTVDLSSATTFDIADLRLAFQIQRWMERNNRAGVRYTEFLKAHFGVSPRDERLQRAEYIGGSKSPVIVSEVLQTSETDTTPQGNLAGHGITVSSAYCGKYHVKEYGLIMGIMSVMPKPAYSQGIDRQWLRRTKYDFYFPEFANLSEQAIENVELCAKNGDATHNTGIFGYQGRYDEMRTKNNMYCAGMRSTYDYWHLGRVFDPANPPALNTTFITCTPRKDIFAAPSEPGLIINFGNTIHAFRPMPIMAEPGLIDHD